MLTERESCLILGVDLDATYDDILAARRRLARSAHPDSGGSHHAMVEVNEACRVLLSLLASKSVGAQSSRHTAAPSQGGTSHEPARPDVSPDSRDRIRQGFRDAPSFVINALPVEAFEVLMVAAANLGEIVDEDPPYLLEVLVRDPGPLWCRFELFPDAGSTTVVLSCDVEVGYRVYSVEEIRDLWIATINATTLPD